MELAALKESLRKLAPSAMPLARSLEVHPTGLRDLDALLCGGLPRGTLSEISGDTSSGKTALTLSIAATFTAAGQLVAYLNARSQLYPPTAAALGVDLSHLLLVSFERANTLDVDLARATEILIRARHIPLIIIDLPDPRLLSAKRIARLRQTANAVGASILALCDDQGSVNGASVRIQVWPHKRKARKGPRRVELQVIKGARRADARTTIELPTHRVDHSPPAPVKEILRRTDPGVAPTPPMRAISRGAA